MDLFRTGIERVFSGMSREDEKRLTDALRTMHDVLKNVELNND